MLNCVDVTYENREQGPGVSYKTREVKEKWTPVIRKKRKARRCESSESDSDGSVVDVSYSRLVRYEERDKTPGLAIIFRRGPATWVPIQAAKQEPIAARTRSKTLNT